MEADIEPTLSDASRREAELEIKKYFQDPTREELQHLSDAELIELCREIC